MSTMEIVYTLVIHTRDGPNLEFVSRIFKEIHREILDFHGKYSSDLIKPAYSIEVELHESVGPNPDSMAARNKTVKARHGLHHNQVNRQKKHHGRGRPKGWKKGMTYEEARKVPEGDEEGTDDPFNA